MNRRTVLAQLGTTLTAGALAGCFGGDGATPTDTTTTTTPPDPTIVATAAVGDRASVAFPENNRPHELRVVNRSDIERKLEVFVDRDGTDVYERLDHLAPNEGVVLRLVEPGTYTIQIRVGSTPGATIEVPRDRFDCNQSVTEATVQDGGVVRTDAWSTMMGCPTPAVGETTLQVTDAGCATQRGDTATVTTDGERVVVTGTVITPTPCYDLAFRPVTIGDGALRIVVEATESDQAVCAECLGGIAYEAEVTLEHAVPARVVVEHATGGESTVVARTSL
ncbi:MAG: hypothetical protein ABEJ57_09105 [Halobacteriaceae archaeon]